jgi:hypothetical protein
MLARPTRHEGRIARRHETRAWDAVDAVGVGARREGQGGRRIEPNPVSPSRRAGRTAPTRTAKACGPGTRCWCQAFAEDAIGPTGRRCIAKFHEATEARGNSSPRRARHKPSNHCAGKAGLFPASPVVFPLCIACAMFSTGAMGAGRHPVFPAPSSFGGRRMRTNLGRIAPREREIVSGV